MEKSSILAKAQKLGKSLMLPIAVMPVVGIMLRLGVLWNIPAITSAGEAVFANMGILFAIGVAIGYAKNNDGAAALAAAVGYYTIDLVSKSFNESINMGVLGGIIAGLLAGNLYNRFKDITLPDFLAFFAGKRFVPIITSIASLIIGIIAGFLWPTVQGGIDSVAKWIIGAGAAGMFGYGFLNRLLIPTGLHHIINTVVWFTFGSFTTPAGDVVTGDISRFLAGDPTAGIFQAGFFPIMMFGLPAAAIAMILAAKKKNRAKITGLFISVAFTSFLTGITEPIEFAFMFIAPGLYLVHALLTGLSLAVANMLGILHGFAFSAGAIDFGLNMHLATKGWMLIPLGLVMFVLYFGIFYGAIKVFNLKTPGREEDDEEEGSTDEIIKSTSFDSLAEEYIDALGGKDNIVEIECCITRLRLKLKNSDLVNDKKLKSMGAQGVIKLGKTSAQVIVGTQVEKLLNAINKILQYNRNNL